MTQLTEAGVARPEIVTDQVVRPGPRWLAVASSADHKDVGRMYIATALAFGAFAITELVLMRIQLLAPDATIIAPEVFNQLLSAYGVTGLLFFAVPLLCGLYSYLVPLQIGARAPALPRVNQLSYWLYLAGAVILYVGFLWRPSEAGTTAIPPLSDVGILADRGVDTWVVGVGLATLGFVLFAVNVVATIHNQRAPGLAWRRLPLLSWSAIVSAYVLLVVGPIMLAALTMLAVDRNFDGVFFDPTAGAPILYQHLSWIFLSGAYAIVLVGAFGVISEILPTFARQPQFGHRAIAGSLAAFATLVVLAWMQNMYSAPIGVGWLYFAMLMAVAALIPVGLILFNWIATLAGGEPQLKPPLLFAIGAIVLITIGLVGELMLSVIPIAWQAANTGVAWGDTHLALIGAGVLGGFAALHYWFPKICGRLMGEGLGRASFWAILIGTLLMVWPIQLAGLEGMPVDVNQYFGGTGITAFNVIGSLGSFLFAAGVILALVNAALSYGRGVQVGPDPWGGATLEWFAPSPPPEHNFDLIPDVRSAEPVREIREAVRRGTTTWVPPIATPSGERPAGKQATEPATPEPEVEEPASTGAAQDAREEPAGEPPSGSGDAETP